VWTPDGQRIVFASTRGNGVPNLYWQRADRTGGAQRLTDSSHTQIPGSFDKSGRVLAFSEVSLSSSGNVMVLPIEGDEAAGWKAGRPRLFQEDAIQPMFSPVGRWIAYVTRENGRGEVVVRPFTGSGPTLPVSINGGQLPRWSRSRPELLFNDPGLHIMAAGYTVDGDSLRLDKPHQWAPAPVRLSARQDYDVHPGGDRIVAAGLQENLAGAEQNDIRMILNLGEQLRRIAPATR
jgi:hypothetical protein